ncbi:MAG: hypothetical protein ACQES5_07085 [Thermodesulfobacteriota bacterium]
MNEMEKMVDLMIKVQVKSLEEMNNSQSLEERKVNSEILLNISKSFSNVFESISDVAAELEDGLPFDD